MIVDFIGPCAAVANVVMVVMWGVAIRRARRLEFLLGQLCIRAFVHQHLPIWRAWGQAFGYEFKVSLVEPEPHKMSDRA
jgi:hypothetical protein